MANPKKAGAVSEVGSANPRAEQPVKSNISSRAIKDM